MSINLIKKKINDALNKEVDKITQPSKRNKLIYQVTLDDRKVRFNFKRGSIDADGYIEEARLQMVAYNNGVKVPEVLFIDHEIKISQWIDGVEMYDVINEKEPNVQLGELIGKMNSTQDDGKYLALTDLTKHNSIWTGEELYFIDFCLITRVDYEEAIQQASVGVGAWIHPARWQWFIEGYLKYHPNLDIYYFIETAKEKRAYWQKRRGEMRKHG